MLKNRRNFIRYILSGIALSTISSLAGIYKFFTPEGFTTTSIAFPKDPSARKVYNHVEEFWLQFPDPVAKELNHRFMSQGKLLSMRSHLTKSKRSAVLTKVYRSEADYIEFHQTWRNASPKGEAELQKVTHRFIGAHLATSDLMPMDIS